MRFLVDESTGRKICELLNTAGHDTIFVGDKRPGSADETVLAWAESEERILVTDDKDFGELVFRLDRPTTGVVLLRTSTANSRRRVRILLDVIRNMQLEGSFTTVTENRIKTRKLRSRP
jgi:predicted nuclease of predicted toxin-antitoxin system